MTRSSPSPLPISDLAEVRLERLLGEQAALQSKLRGIDFQIKALCRVWSDAHGYPVTLNPEQIKRAREAMPKREDS